MGENTVITQRGNSLVRVTEALEKKNKKKRNFVVSIGFKHTC